jgi:hypothetical protein
LETHVSGNKAKKIKKRMGFSFGILISGNGYNTSMLYLEEESPSAGLQIMLNIRISGFTVSRGANA